MRSQTDGAGWTPRRATRHHGAALEPYRPSVPAYLDLRELARWNRKNLRARLSYYAATNGPAHHTLPGGGRDDL